MCIRFAKVRTKDNFYLLDLVPFLFSERSLAIAEELSF